MVSKNNILLIEYVTIQKNKNAVTDTFKPSIKISDL